MRLDPDSPVLRFFARLFDLVWLQMLFLLTSVPLITVGAGLTAMFSVCRKLQEDSVTSVTKTYFAEFRGSFRQSTVFWLLLLAAIVLLVLDVRYYSGVYGAFLSVPHVVAYVLLALAWVEFVFVFPMLAWFENKLLLHLRNALLLAVMHILALVLVSILYACAWYVSQLLFPIFLLIGFSGTVYLAALVFGIVFRKHGGKPQAGVSEGASD